MKKFLLAASAAVAAFAMTPAASAADYLPGGPGGINLSPTQLTSYYGADIDSGLINDIFHFSAPISGIASAEASFSSTPASAIGSIFGNLYDDSNTWLASFEFTTFKGVLVGALDPVNVIGGKDYTLVFTGLANAATSYGGNLVITPVPEPTTWAMMIVGIAAIGFTMRRSQTTRVAFS